MTYKPLNAPSTLPPPIGEIRRHLDSRLGEVHCLLRLPRPEWGFQSDCGYAAVNVLLSLISGSSIVLFKQHGGSGRIFKEYMNKKYWPFDPPSGLSDVEASEALYDEYRNIFSHSMGVHIDYADREKNIRKPIIKSYKVKIKKSKFGLADSLLEEIEESIERPTWMSPTLLKTPEKLVVLVEGLYWGFRRSIEEIFKDTPLMVQAGHFMSNVHSERYAG